MRNIASLFVLAVLAASGVFAQARTQEYDCRPAAVKVGKDRIEIWCEEATLLEGRSPDRFREVDRFAFPMISRDYQPQFGSQVKLLDYYLDVAQRALVNGRLLRIWFETDYTVSQTYGCDPRNCRQLVGVAITSASAAQVPSEDPFEETTN